MKKWIGREGERRDKKGEKSKSKEVCKKEREKEGRRGKKNVKGGGGRRKR